VLEGEVSGDNDEGEDQVGEKGAKMRGHPSWLGIGIIINRSAICDKWWGVGRTPMAMLGSSPPPHQAVCTGFWGSIQVMMTSYKSPAGWAFLALEPRIRVGSRYFAPGRPLSRSFVSNNQHQC
jgi:hypothetical protein